MKKVFSIFLLILGITLIICGVNAANSFGSDLSRIFTGAPSDKSVWLFVCRLIASVAGFFGLFGKLKV